MSDGRARLTSRQYLGGISTRSRRHLHATPAISRQAVLAHASYLDIASTSAARASASADALARLRTRREAFANFLAKLVRPLGSESRAAPRHPAHTIAVTPREYRAHTIPAAQIGQPASRDRVLDISYCADLAPADFSAVAHALKECAEIESPG